MQQNKYAPMNRLLPGLFCSSLQYSPAWTIPAQDPWTSESKQRRCYHSRQRPRFASGCTPDALAGAYVCQRATTRFDLCFLSGSETTRKASQVRFAQACKCFSFMWFYVRVEWSRVVQRQVVVRKVVFCGVVAEGM